jgi:hypothetical protein
MIGLGLSTFREDRCRRNTFRSLSSIRASFRHPQCWTFRSEFANQRPERTGRAPQFAHAGLMIIKVV